MDSVFRHIIRQGVDEEGFAGVDGVGHFGADQDFAASLADVGGHGVAELGVVGLGELVVHRVAAEVFGGGLAIVNAVVGGVAQARDRADEMAGFKGVGLKERLGAGV